MVRSIIMVVIRIGVVIIFGDFFVFRFICFDFEIDFVFWLDVYIRDLFVVESVFINVFCKLIWGYILYVVIFKWIFFKMLYCFGGLIY